MKKLVLLSLLTLFLAACGEISLDGISDFSLKVSEMSAAPGESAEETLNITRTNMIGSVNLSVSGEPEGVSVSFSENPATGSSVIMKVEVAGTVANGSYPLTVSGTVGSMNRSTDTTLTVEGTGTPTNPDPANPDPSDPDPSNPNPDNPGPSDPDPSDPNPDPSDPDPSDPTPDPADPDPSDPTPDPSDPDPDDPDPSDPDPDDPDPSDPSDPDPSDPDPSDPNPTDPDPTPDPAPKKLPDLVVSAASISVTDTCKPNNAILMVKAKITNQGTAPSPKREDVGVVGALDTHGNNWGNGKGLPAIAVGESASVSFPVYYLKSDPGHMEGGHVFRVSVNRGNWFAESDTSNNTYSPDIKVVIPEGLCKPDLEVRVSGQEEVYPGASVKLDTEARNTGSSDAAGTASAGKNGYMVDLVLSTDESVPAKFATYAPTYSEDVLLKGGRLSNTPDLAPSDKKLWAGVSYELPSDTPPGKYFVCAQVDAGQKIAEASEANNVSCNPLIVKSFPKPVLEYTGKESYSANGKDWVRFRLRVVNWQDYPDFLFAASPELPPCGANANASRTWVYIFNGTSNAQVKGFCALGKATNMQGLWFAVEKGKVPPSSVYVKLIDRKTGKEYVSNKEAIPFNEITKYSLPAQDKRYLFNERPSVKIAYQSNHPGGVRIWAQPYDGSQFVQNGAFEPSGILPTPGGTVDRFFTVTKGTKITKVNRIRIVMQAANSTEVLAEKFINVNYVFYPAYISTSGRPSSPKTFDYGERVKVSFSYKKGVSDGVRIFVRPFTGGARTPGYSADPSPLYSAASGSDTQSFTIPTGTAPVKIDKLRIRIVSATNNSVVYYEQFLDVDYTFK